MSERCYSGYKLSDWPWRRLLLTCDLHTDGQYCFTFTPITISDLQSLISIYTLSSDRSGRMPNDHCDGQVGGLEDNLLCPLGVRSEYMLAKYVSAKPQISSDCMFVCLGHIFITVMSQCFAYTLVRLWHETHLAMFMKTSESRLEMTDLPWSLTSHENDLVLVTKRSPALHENIKWCYIYECCKANSNAGCVQTQNVQGFIRSPVAGLQGDRKSLRKEVGEVFVV